MNGRKRLFLPPCDLTSATLVFSISLSSFLFSHRVRIRIEMNRDRACFDDGATYFIVQIAIERNSLFKRYVQKFLIVLFLLLRLIFNREETMEF